MQCQPLQGLPMGLPMRIELEYCMTRYPRGKRGNKWTIKELDAIKPEWKGDTLNDGDGLSGEVRVNSEKVSIPFRLAFKWQGKVAWHYCGTYPATDLALIRAERDKARELIKQGIDPRAKKIASKIEAQAAVEATIQADAQKRSETLTFNSLYTSWITDGVSRSDGNKYIAQSLNKHALPVLGSIEIRHLSEHHLRDLYRSIIADGKIATAVELSKDISQMLRWAEKRKPWRALLVDGNPAELVEINKLLPNDYTKERTRRLSIDEIRKLKSVFDQTTETYAQAKNKYGTERPLKKEIQIAMWLCLGTLCRIGELLMTEWKHVNFDERTWFIPAINTKGARGKKRDQLVYLSDFSLRQFGELHTLTGDSEWVFPARYKEGHVDIKSASKQVGDRQIKFKQRSKKLQYRIENDSLVLGDEEWTPHDLRRTGATMMQTLKINRDVINLCQNHVIGTKIDRVYLLDDYAEDKRDAWNKLGDRLDVILNATNVIILNNG
jgi:integrase